MSSVDSSYSILAHMNRNFTNGRITKKSSQFVLTLIVCIAITYFSYTLKPHDYHNIWINAGINTTYNCSKFVHMCCQLMLVIDKLKWQQGWSEYM